MEVKPVYFSDFTFTLIPVRKTVHLFLRMPQNKSPQPLPVGGGSSRKHTGRRAMVGVLVFNSLRP